MSTSIRVLPYGGVWETLGAGVLPGYLPADPQLVWDEHGPLTLSAQMPGVGPKRASRDLEAFTPIEVLGPEDDPVWGGRIIETPGARGGITISAEGMQSYLDDHEEPILYLRDSTAGFSDIRGAQNAFLYGAGGGAGWQAAGNVTSDDRALSISIGKGETFRVAGGIGAYIDLGDDTFAQAGGGVRAKAVGTVLDIFIINPSGHPFTYYVRGVTDGGLSSQHFGGTGWNDLLSAVPLTDGTSGKVGGTWPTPVQSICVFIYNGSGADVAVTADVVLQIRQATIYSSTAYFAAGTSQLKASDVVKDALVRVPLLSQDTTGIDSTLFAIRSLGGPGETATPRTRIERANDYHRYRWAIDPRGRLTFKPQPDVPTLVVNTEDEGVDYTDSSLNSGRDLFSHALGLGTTGGGQPLRRLRSLSTSIPARRGLMRSQTLTAQAAVQAADLDILLDLFLQAHARPPMKGSLTITGAVVEDLLSGRVLSPLEVAARAGEKIRLSDLTDPLTGDIGRDVQMIGSTFSKGQANITLDEDRSRWEALMARMAAVQGN
jgi:hypothetical protein